MMKLLLRKEFSLLLHPTSLIFLALSAMVLIPNYPYYVSFFYACLGVFFALQVGRENQDLLYSMLLPVRKSQIVQARFWFVVLVELAQLVCTIPFAILRAQFPMPGNQAGMDANLAFYGLALGMLGIFNFVFLRRYFKAPEQVGRAFIRGAAGLFVYMALAEAATFAIPFFRDTLDTPDPQALGAKLVVLVLGGLVFCGLTVWACRLSQNSFEKLDI